MLLSPPPAAPGRLLAIATDFPLEWSAVAGLMLIDAVWAQRVGFSVSVSSLDGRALLMALAAAILFRAMLQQNRGSLSAEFLAVSIAAATAFGVLSYLCCTVAQPLVDERLLRLDRALGFDWLFWFHLIVAHPVVETVLRLAYDSLVYQGLYAAILFGLLGRRDRLRELFWVIFISGILTSAGSAFFPALGAYDAFGLRSLSDYIPDMERLRAGADLHFELGKLTGIVTFPSFHTTMALVYCYGFRRTEAIGRVIFALNMAMLPAIPFYGGHYFVDMVGGAAVAVLSIMAVRSLSALGHRRADGAQTAAPFVPLGDPGSP